MTRFLAVAAALAVTSLSAPAFAATASAQLQAPIASPAKVLAGGAVWRCEGDVCRTDATTDRTLDIDGCRALAKAVGPVASFGGDFDATKLAKCDKGLTSVVATKSGAPAVVAAR